MNFPLRSAAVLALLSLISLGCSSNTSAVAAALPATSSLARHAVAAAPSSAHPVAVSDVAPPTSPRIPTRRDAEVRALYFTGLMAGMDHGKRIAEEWRRNGGNAIVFDIKDEDGIVTFHSQQPYANQERHAYINDLPAWVAWLHAHGLYAIARIAVFKDIRLVKAHPELAIHSRSTGGVWYENGKPSWVDPSNPAVQNYNIGLAVEAAKSGVDEIQFDYLRFPTGKSQADARFDYQKANPNAERSDFITGFLYRAHQALAPLGVHISIDVFGVDAWYRDEDLRKLGQDIVSLAYYCDTICPMIYPSHFYNFDGYSNPGDAPEHFIHEAMDRFNAQIQDTGVQIRPWLQAFAWHTHIFSPQYIQVQVQTSKQHAGNGFMLWNAGNKYDVAQEAMPVMMSKQGVYVNGGYLYPVSPNASPAPPAPATPGRS